MAWQKDDYISLNRSGTPGTAGGATGTYYVEKARNLFNIGYVESATEPASADRFAGLIWRNTSSGTVAGVPPSTNATWNGSAWSNVTQAAAGALTFKDTWDAAANSPTIPAAASSNTGHVYVVSTAGTTALDGVSDWEAGDWAVSNGTVWRKIDNTEPTATTAISGNVRLATAAEITAGTSTSAVMTVANVVGLISNGRWMGDSLAP